jgi:hypothetical protein
MTATVMRHELVWLRLHASAIPNAWRARLAMALRTRRSLLVDRAAH